MTEGQLVMIVGEMPKGYENSGRIGTLLFRDRTTSTILMPDGQILKYPNYAVIDEQIDS
jgi:hypothetical protein